MNYKKIIYMCIAIIIAVVLLYRFVGNVPQSKKVVPPQEQKAFLMQTNSEGSVDITVTPKTLERGKAVQFDITFTTHMGSLDFDLLKTSRLVDDKGATYKPVSWSGGSGGHHLNGTLSFSPLSDTASKVTLTLLAIGNAERVFSWNLK